MRIKLIYDVQALAAPPSFRHGMHVAAKVLEATFTNNITIKIDVGYGEVAGDPIPDGTGVCEPVGYGISYSDLRKYLAMTATSSADRISVHSLPKGSSLEGHSDLPSLFPQAKAFGLRFVDHNPDGYVGIGTGFTGNSLVGAALHELTHAMGRVVGGWSLDLFRFNENGLGHHVFDTNVPSKAAYFSINSGKTELADFGIHSDPSDFLNPPNSNLTPHDPFDEHLGGTVLTAVDINIMDVLGFNTVQPSVADASNLDTANSLAINSHGELVDGYGRMLFDLHNFETNGSSAHYGGLT